MLLGYFCQGSPGQRIRGVALSSLKKKSILHVFRRLLQVILNRNIIFSSTRREPLSHPRSTCQDKRGFVKPRDSLTRRIARSVSPSEINKCVKSPPCTHLPGGVRRSPREGGTGGKRREGGEQRSLGQRPGSGHHPHVTRSEGAGPGHPPARPVCQALSGP